MYMFLGLDIGSEKSKAVLMSDGEMKAYRMIGSGSNYRSAAEALRENLFRDLGLTAEDISYTIATGQGARNVTFCDAEITEIRCSARGINHVCPSVRTVIDLQSHCSQVIRVNEHGQVTNFSASEKCAIGSGHFLHVIANVLQLKISEVGPVSLLSNNPVDFTTGCAVFAESEAITRVAEGISKEDILAGVHKTLAGKMSSLADRVGFEEPCAIIGGGALDIGLCTSIEEKMGIRLVIPEQPQLITAMGAALVGVEQMVNKGKARVM